LRSGTFCSTWMISRDMAGANQPRQAGQLMSIRPGAPSETIAGAAQGFQR